MQVWSKMEGELEGEEIISRKSAMWLRGSLGRARTSSVTIKQGLMLPPSQYKVTGDIRTSYSGSVSS